MPVVTAVASEVIPTGEYLGKVTGITIEDGQFGKQFKWTFINLDEEYEDKEHVGWTSTSPSLKGKFMKWASACLGHEIEEGERVDTEELIGCKVIMILVVKTSDKDGTEYNKLDGLRPRKKAGKNGGNGKAAPVEAESEDEAEPVGAKAGGNGNGKNKPDPFEDE